MRLLLWEEETLKGGVQPTRRGKTSTSAVSCRQAWGFREQQEGLRETRAGTETWMFYEPEIRRRLWHDPICPVCSFVVVYVCFTLHQLYGVIIATMTCMHFERATGWMLASARNFSPHQDIEQHQQSKRLPHVFFTMNLPLPPAALLSVTIDLFDLFWNFLSRESFSVCCVYSWLLSLSAMSFRFSYVVACIIVLPFLLLSNIPWSGSIMVCLSIHLWMDIWVATGNIKTASLCELGEYQGVGLLYHIGSACL